MNGRSVARAAVLIGVLVMLVMMVFAYSEHVYADTEIPEFTAVFENPVPGTDSNVAPVVNTYDGSHCFVEACGWISEDGKQEPPTYFKFEEGKKYKLWVTVRADSGYYFPDNVLVNVENAGITKILGVHTSGDYSAVAFEGEVVCKNAGKEKNPLAVKGKTAKVSYSKLKKKAQTLAVSKVLTVSGAKGTVTYTKKSGNKGITINKKTGKVTVKKGLKKSVYKITVNVTAAGDEEYEAGSKTVTFKVKVK